MVRKKKICVECGSEEYIFSHGRCKSCASRSYAKRSVNHKKKEPTGEKGMFDEIWNERPHISFVSGADLEVYSPSGRFPNLFYNCFSHMLPKGRYERFRLFKRNVILITPQEHLDWHSMSKDRLIEKDNRWIKVFELYDTLKEEYDILY